MRCCQDAEDRLRSSSTGVEAQEVLQQKMEDAVIRCARTNEGNAEEALKRLNKML